jgi:hypothetical protein
MTSTSKRISHTGYHYHFLAVLAAGVLSLVQPYFSYAADEDTQGPIQVKVRVETKPEPTKALGILLSTTGVREVSETSIEKVGEKLYDIAFTVERSGLTDDTVATAMTTSAEGEVSFANVTPALLSESHSITGNIPECAGEDPTSIAILNQLGPLRQLVDVREERSKFAREKIRRVMDDSMLSKLSRFEKHFGLGQSKEALTADLPAEKLLDRLSRINFALAEFKTFKKAAQDSTKKSN